MAVAPPPPGGPWYRTHWTRYNRPYPGCGCIYVILIVLLVWWLVSLLYPPVGFWYFWF